MAFSGDEPGNLSRSSCPQLFFGSSCFSSSLLHGQRSGIHAFTLEPATSVYGIQASTPAPPHEIKSTIPESCKCRGTHPYLPQDLSHGWGPKRHFSHLKMKKGANTGKREQDQKVADKSIIADISGQVSIGWLKTPIPIRRGRKKKQKGQVASVTYHESSTLTVLDLTLLDRTD